MSRLLSPADALTEVDVGRNRYRGRIVDDPHPADARLMRQFGYTVASTAGPAHTGGRQCIDCGFRGWFTRCGRCGSSCMPISD